MNKYSFYRVETISQKFKDLDIENLEEITLKPIIKVFKVNEIVRYKNHKNKVFKIIQRQGNDFYTCRLLIKHYSSCKAKYEETNEFVILHSLILERVK